MCKKTISTQNYWQKINLNTTDKNKNAILSLEDMGTVNQEMFKQKHFQEKVISAEEHFQKKNKKLSNIHKQLEMNWSWTSGQPNRN